MVDSDSGSGGHGLERLGERGGWEREVERGRGRMERYSEQCERMEEGGYCGSIPSHRMEESGYCGSNPSHRLEESLYISPHPPSPRMEEGSLSVSLPELRLKAPGQQVSHSSELTFYQGPNFSYIRRSFRLRVEAWCKALLN